MFEVLDNGIPAKYPDYNVDPSWANNRFETYEEAMEYTNEWLGYPDLSAWLQVNTPFDYNGFGDTIEIRLTPETQIS